jgi:hypothetical protein
MPRVVARRARLFAIGLAVLGTGVLAGSGLTAAGATGSVDLKGSYELSGAVSKHGSFVDPELVARSCAEIGSHGTGPAFVGGPDHFAVPGPLPATGSVENIFFTAGVLYKGPGTFSKEDLLNGGGTDIIVGKNSYNAVAPAARASMTVRANGSGSFTFSNAPPVKAGKSLSGRVTWTCTQ